MKRLLQLTVITILTITTFSFKLFLVGGRAYEAAPLYNELAKTVPSKTPIPGGCLEDWSITTCPKIAVVTSSKGTAVQGLALFQNDTATSLSFKKIFLQYGMSPKQITIHANNYLTARDPSTSQGSQNLIILNAADIIFFCGGDQAYHTRAWLNDDGSQSDYLKIILDKANANNVVISGNSAGSMIWGDYSFGYGTTYGAIFYANSVGLANKLTTDANIGGTLLNDIRNGSSGLQYSNNNGKMPGMKWLSNWHVDPHFHVNGRFTRVAAMMIDMGKTIGYGVDQNTSFSINNNYGKVYGQFGVTIIDLNEATNFPSQSYFKLKNARVHYLTEGDQYNFTSKTVISSKSLIRSPRFIEASHSTDIIGAYEGSRILTRLVDQTPHFNYGITKTPTGYPADTTVFQVLVRRGIDTKGYRNGQSYTVVNAYVDYNYLTDGHDHSNLCTH